MRFANPKREIFIKKLPNLKFGERKEMKNMKKTLLCISLVCTMLALGACGTAGKHTYTNGKFDIGYIADSSFEVADKKELAALSDNGFSCEFMVTVPTTGSALVVTIQDDVYGGEEAYLRSMMETLDAPGYSISYGEIIGFEIADEDYAAISYTVEADGITMSMSTYARSEDGKLMIINVSYNGEAEHKMLLGGFVELD